MKKLLIILAVIAGGAWLWFRFRQPSALEKHFAEEDALSKIGQAVNNMMLRAVPPIGTVGKLPLTGAVVSPISPQVTDPLSPEAFYTGLFPQGGDMGRASVRTPYDFLNIYGNGSPGLIWN